MVDAKLNSDIPKYWEPHIAEDLLKVLNKSENYTRNIIGLTPSSETSLGTEFIQSLVKKLGSVDLIRKVTCEVPSEILNCNFSVTLEDIKVDSNRQPDDKLYSTHRELRDYIPRGMTIMHITDSNDTFSDVVIYANKKFTGSPADEDNDEIVDQNWRDFFVQPYECAKQILCMEKVNGEAAHISGRYIGDKFFLIAGSKNVHIVFNEKSHIDLYDGPRYVIAKEIAHFVFDIFSNLDHCKKEGLSRFLHKSKGTIACEILRTCSQHIVPITTNELKAFCITPPPVQHESQNVSSLTLVSPLHVLQLLNLLGFTVPNYEVIEVSKVNERNTYVRELTHTEGEVQYFLDETENTIGLLKVKTLWYIMIRAIRQRTFNSYYVKTKTPNLQDAHHRMTKRMKEFIPWLRISTEVLKYWTDIGNRWLDWLFPNIENYTKDSLMAEFPTVWEQYIQEYGVTEATTSGDGNVG